VKRVALSQGTEQWKLWRRAGVGGSDIAAIVGLSPFEDHTRAQILAEKVHGVERPQSQAMYRGTVLEPWARLLYERRQRVSAPPACVEHDDYPWARVSLDGLCTNGAAVQRLEWILELKAPGWETHSAALCGVVPDYYACQCQWQMLCAGIGLCDFVCFNPGKRFTPAGALAWEEWKTDPSRPLDFPGDWLAEVRLAADPECQAWLLAEAGAFWLEVEEARARQARAEFA
jgi:putative phage-type endonuclease